MRHRGKLTLTGVVAIVGTVGGLLYAGSERLIELDQKLGRSAYADSVLDARLDRIERRLRLKKHEMERSAPREGIVRRMWRLIF